MLGILAALPACAESESYHAEGCIFVPEDQKCPPGKDLTPSQLFLRQPKGNDATIDDVDSDGTRAVVKDQNGMELSACCYTVMVTARVTDDADGVPGDPIGTVPLRCAPEYDPLCLAQSRRHARSHGNAQERMSMRRSLRSRGCRCSSWRMELRAICYGTCIGRRSRRRSTRSVAGRWRGISVPARWARAHFPSLPPLPST
jgi:hypothetical protein